MVAVATGPGPSTDSSATSKPDREPETLDHPSNYTEGKNFFIYDDLHPEKKISAGYPNPVGEPVGLSRDPFTARLQLQALGFAARFIPPPTGPAQARTPDAGMGGRDTSGTLDWNMLDPIAPVADIYEGRGPKPSLGGRRMRIQHPGIRALYPETSGPAGDEDDKTLAAIAAINTGRRMPAPEAPGDPAASTRLGANVVAVSAGAAAAPGSPSAGMVVAYSAGVTSPTIDFDLAGRARRPGR